MCDDDSEHFESADEGPEIIPPIKTDSPVSSENTNVKVLIKNADYPKSELHETKPTSRVKKACGSRGSVSKANGKNESQQKCKKKKRKGNTERESLRTSVPSDVTNVIENTSDDVKQNEILGAVGVADKAPCSEIYVEESEPPVVTEIVQNRLEEPDVSETECDKLLNGVHTTSQADRDQFITDVDDVPKYEQRSEVSTEFTTPNQSDHLPTSEVPSEQLVSQSPEVPVGDDTIAESEARVLKDEPNEVDGSTDMVEDLWNPEALTATATNLVRGVGDGLSSLADALAHVVKFGANADDEDPELLERRKHRMMEEKAEREAIADAWSNVWNTAWGTNDGWDVEDIDIPDADETKSENKKRSLGHNSNSASTSESHSKPPDLDEMIAQSKTESTAFWDWSGVSSLAQQLTTSFQSKGLNLVHEGVSVLEKIGRKTMSVIEENDPGFQYTKNFLRPPGLRDRPNLSQVIREAYERHQAEELNEASGKECNRGNFTAQLELNRALVHLEALELVSDKAESQLHIQLDGLSATEGSDLMTLHDGLLESIWKTLQLDAMEDDESGSEFPDESTWKLLRCKKNRKLGSYGSFPKDLSEENAHLWLAFERSLWHVKTIYPGERLLQNVAKVWDEMTTGNEDKSSQDVFFSAIGALAETTSAHLEYLHKLAECTLVRTQEPSADYDRLTSIVAITFRAAIKLTDALCSQYARLIKSTHKATDVEKPVKSANQMVASLLLECGNAQNYAKNAARLLVPVFQLACVNSIRAGLKAE